MRAALTALILAALLGACAGTPVGLTGECRDRFEQCARAPGDTEYCEAERQACRDLRDEGGRRAGDKARAYEEFKREREGSR